MSNTVSLDYKVMINDSTEAIVKFVGTDLEEKFMNALYKNLQMLSNITNLYVIEKSFSEDESSNMKVVSFSLNTTNAKTIPLFNSSFQISPDIAALTILNKASAALFNIRKPGQDTPPLQILDVYNTGNNTGKYYDWNGILVVGYYNGPIITTLGSLVLVLVSFVIYIIIILIYRSPGNLAWEVINSHGRLYGDVLLSGPNRVLEWCSVVNCDYIPNSHSNLTGYVQNGGVLTNAK